MQTPLRRSLPLAPAAVKGRPLEDEVRPLDRAWRPSYAVWEVTLACDLACHHCGSRAGRSRPDELDTPQALDLIDQMADLGVNEVTLIGGEAYLRPDWLELIARLRTRGMRITMATGGRGLTRERARDAAAAGLSAVSVSVDGLEPEHDAQRALSGSFAAAMRAMDAVREAGMRLTANTQINRVSLPVLEDLFEHLANAGIRAWQVQLTTAMGRAGDADDLLLEPYQLLEVMPRLARLKQRGDARGVTLWPGNNIGYFGPFEPILRGHFRAGYRGSCGAGRVSLGVEANGDIKGCPSLPSTDYVGGNVRERPLREIWERSSALRFTRDHTAQDLSGYCARCYYAHECRGGCHWTAHVLLGHRGDNPYCHHRASMLLAEGLRERVRRTASAPGLPFDHGRHEVITEPWPEGERRRIEAFTDEALRALYPTASP
jgi:radical SAM protein with 4Fe4S-binding SPASM domain